MNDGRTREAEPEKRTTLSPPHFDELAVAVAQPVQPIPPRQKKRMLRSSLFLIAYLIFIAAVVSIAYLSPPSSRADVSDETVSSEAQPDNQPFLDDSSPVMTGGESIATPVILRGKPHSRRASRLRFENHTMQIVVDGSGKPVARKVGEIRYSRSSDRP